MTPAITLGPIDLAKIAVTSTSSHFIVLEVENNGSSSRWQAQFPSLQLDQLEALATQSATFLQFATRSDAVGIFELLTHDAAQHSIGVMTGTITLVTLPHGEDDGHDVVAWDLDDENRPVWNGREWTQEMIVDRI